MAYCPEDGAKMETNVDRYRACYSCPTCGTHWAYDGDNPAYCPIPIGDDCPVCEQVIPRDDPTDPTVKEARDA